MAFSTVSPDSSVPAPQFTDRGFLAPPEPAVLGGVLADVDAAFGGDLNTSLETPQGQLSSSMAACVGNAQSDFCALANGVDPSYAAGRMQDAIARIYFIERDPAQPTVVIATCSGLTGVGIAAGSLAIAADESVYASLEDATIPVSGSVDVQFACLTPGPIPCPAGSLAIYRAIPGWDSVTNAADGVVGNNAETRDAFEARRSASVAKNAMGYLAAVRGAVLAVDGVLDAYVTENDDDTPATVGDYTLAANSLYVAVIGGRDADVARAIWTKKAPGCSYNGNTVVTVQDTSSGYTAPFPSYPVTFERPSALTVMFAVNVQNGPTVPADAVTQIQVALIAAFAGEDGGPRARIGGVLYATRFNSAVAALGAWAQVISLQVGSKNTPIASFTASVTGTVMDVTAVDGGSGAIAVGQTISGHGVPPGVRVASLGTGVGGVGTYNLTQPFTVSVEPMKSALANQNLVQVYIDQTPTLSAADVLVTLTS